MLIRSLRRTEQPRWAAALRPREQYKFLLTPYHDLAGSLLSATGAPQLASTPYGIGYTFGSGNYFSTPVGTLIDSNGAGDDISVNVRHSITFVVTSNGAADAIASWGETETSGGPQVLLQNNSGSLRCLVAGSTYITYGSIEVGKLYTADIVYSDPSPYVWSFFVNGELVGTHNSYNNVLDTMSVYVGTGFGGQTANAVVLQSTLEQGAHVDLSNAWSLERGANPWALYAPRDIRIPLVAASGYTHPTLSNARMGSLTSTSGIPLADYAF